MVGTSVTFQGVEHLAGTAALCADEADVFATLILSLLENEGQREAQGERALAAAAQEFSPVTSRQEFLRFASGTKAQPVGRADRGRPFAAMLVRCGDCQVMNALVPFEPKARPVPLSEEDRPSRFTARAEGSACPAPEQSARLPRRMPAPGVFVSCRHSAEVHGKCDNHGRRRTHRRHSPGCRRRRCADFSTRWRESQVEVLRSIGLAREGGGSPPSHPRTRLSRELSGPDRSG